jgi:hypothetical protein
MTAAANDAARLITLTPLTERERRSLAETLTARVLLFAARNVDALDTAADVLQQLV